MSQHTPKRPYVQPELTFYGEEHVRLYKETGGETGFLWNGASCCILTTTGRKSAAERDTPLICGFDGDDVIVVASYGGAPKHPEWYLNLVANPEVTVQVKADRYKAVARTAQDDERERLWDIMTDVWPNYDEYTKRTTRKIPVVVLERVK